MAADDFFNRWAKRKAEASKAAVEAVPPPAPADALEAKQPAPPPTMADVERLTPDSDYSRFVAGGVDESVKRSAMKKLFSDPHFNVMDGLDIYIDDYSKPDPIPAAMLAMLNHGKALLDPLGELEKPLMRMLETPPALEHAQDAAEAVAAPKTATESETQSETEQPAVEPDTPQASGTSDAAEAMRSKDNEGSATVSMPGAAITDGLAGQDNEHNIQGL